MALSSNRGGAKPRMLSSATAQDVPFLVFGRRKVGVYERDRGVLARRVELPAWLYLGLQQGRFALTGSRAHFPREEIAESKGQLYVSPPPSLFSGPAVGMDMEVFDLLEADPGLLLIQFFVYGNAYRPVDVWQITRQKFLANAKLVTGKASFMPQMMVAISEVEQARARTVLH